MVLFRGTWRIDLGRTFSSGILDSLETFSKFFAILFPAFLIGIAQVEAIRRHNVVFAVICNACRMFPKPYPISPKNLQADLTTFQLLSVQQEEPSY